MAEMATVAQNPLASTTKSTAARSNGPGACSCRPRSASSNWSKQEEQKFRPCNLVVQRTQTPREHETQMPKAS